MWVVVALAVGCGGTGGTDRQGDTFDQVAPADGTGNPGDLTLGDGGDKLPDGRDPGKDLPGNPDVTPLEDGRIPCIEGERSCIGESLVSVCVDGEFQFSTSCGDDAVCRDGYCVKPADCTPGQSAECAGASSVWVCNPEGDGLVLTPCQGGMMCVQGECRQVSCAPGTGQCVTNTSYRTCLEDGSGWGEVQNCGLGKNCVGGKCMTLCEADIKHNTNVGCQYWSVDLDNDPTHHPLFPNQPTPEMFPHSVVIGNPNNSPVSMTFSVVVSCPDGSTCSPSVTTCNGQKGTVCGTPAGTEMEIAFDDPVVPAGQSREFKMPVMNVSGSVLAPKAIRVLASLPVVAYQFNPFDSENAASNDGSLLLPQNALGKTYYAVSLPSRGAIMGFPANHGFVTVVGTEPDTTVEVTPAVKVIANPAKGVPQDGTTPAFLAPGQTYSFLLQPYDVLSLAHMPEGGIVTPGTVPKDLTGTRIQADRPVAVFSGHQVAGVTEAAKLQMTDVWDSCCTEHLEEQLMPVETWGSQALCVKSKPRGYEADRFVVVAGEPGVQLTTIPVIGALHGKTLANAGDQLRVETTESFVLQATGKVQVVQFLMSQGQTQPVGGDPGTGDPSMMILPPSSQYRDEYVFRTAQGYGTNWITVIRPAGALVTLDGTPMSDWEFEPLGDGTWQFAYREVATGSHRLTGDQPFGLMVYGYGVVTAYGYPGGMNLEQ
jgi:hypothetical protein